METFKKIIKGLLITLGIIFILVLIIIGYIWIADPFNIKAITGTDISPASVIKVITNKNTVPVDNIDKNPLLNEDQEARLESIGIDPSDLPSEITPEMQKCFVEKLGEQRATEIIQGAAPTTMDFLKANDCLK